MKPRNNNKTKTFLFFIVVLAFFLRVCRLSSSINFAGDFAWYYLSAKDLLLKGKIPLVGIPSSVPVLKQGALYTWILALALLLGRFHPIVGSYMNIILSSLSTIAIYLVSEKLYSKNTALISSLLVATSPFIIKIDKKPFVVGTLFFLTLMFVWVFIKVLSGQKKYLFLLGFILGVLFQFELAAFILFPVVFVSLAFSSQLEIKSLINLICGGLVGIIPLLLYDLTQGVFIQTLGFGIWAIQKILEGLLGIFLGSRGTNLFSPFFIYMAELIYPNDHTLSLLLLAISFFLFTLRFTLIKKHRNTANLFVLIWLLIGIGGFFLRGIYSQAYMPFIYFPIIVILSSFFSWLIRKTPISGWLSVILVVGSNIIYTLNNPGPEKVSLQEQIQVANLVLQDAHNEKFSILYHGPADNFHTSSNQYQYLLWWKGNEPVCKAEIEYIIWEGNPKKEVEESLLDSIGDKVFVYKKK